MIEPDYADFSTQVEPSPIDLDPISKFNWKSGTFRDRFQSAFNEIIERRTEWLIEQVNESTHPRKVATLTVEDWEDFLIIASKKDLAYEKLERDTLEENAIVADSYETIETWLNADTHSRLKLEGVPDCCVAEIGDRREPIYEAACASESARELSDEHGVAVPDAKSTLNTLWGYQDIALIDHTPCSFECEASHELATENGELLREIGLDEEADLLWEWLDTPVTWDAYHGLAHLRNNYGIGEQTVGDNWQKKTVKLSGDHLEMGISL